MYGWTPQQVSELDKVPALIEAEELVIWLPDIIVDEFERNRPRIIADALKPLRESRLRIPMPSLSEALQERAVLESAVIDTQKAHSVLLKKLERQVASRTLAADKAVAALTSVARTLATGAVLSYARQRRE